MKILANVTLLLVASVVGCRSAATVTVPLPREAAPLGAAPGAFLPSRCLGEDDLRVWRRVDPMIVRPETHATAPGAQCEWSVTMRSGVPVVVSDDLNRPALPPGFSPPQSPARLRAVQQGNAGVLAGFDGGEWGGSLGWYSERGVLRSNLGEDNVVAIVPAFGQFIALTYQGHGSRGRAIQVLDRGGRFEVGETLELPDVPSDGVLETGDTILVSTEGGLLRLSRDFQPTAVLEARWWMLHPVSLALSGHETAYVGMRGVVIELQMSTTPPTETWLYPF